MQFYIFAILARYVATNNFQSEHTLKSIPLLMSGSKSTTKPKAHKAQIINKSIAATSIRAIRALYGLTWYGFSRLQCQGQNKVQLLHQLQHLNERMSSSITTSCLPEDASRTRQLTQEVMLSNWTNLSQQYQGSVPPATCIHPFESNP